MPGSNVFEAGNRRTLVWLETACVEIQTKLANVGLIEKPQTHTLKEVWNAFLEQKTDVKEGTLGQYGHVRAKFFEFFREGDTLESVTVDQMHDWKTFLRKGLAESSVAGVLTKAKALFNWAKSRRWIVESPLDGVGRGSFRNEEGDYFVSMDEYAKLLDACPDDQWRGVISLARIGGLRTPSEALRLRWSDVNWERNRFFVRSPKTARHRGKESRIVPLFAELRRELERLFFRNQTEGEEYVINLTNYRNRERANLGPGFGRIAERAGIDFPRPFDNMRASRSNEVYRQFGAFLESAWIGHSNRVAQDHYLAVQDKDFDEASAWQPEALKSAPSELCSSEGKSLARQ